MNRMIVAIGGTGQIVLQHYLQLYLLGIVREPFRAVVIDTDEVLPPLRTIADFFEKVRYSSEKHVAIGDELPVLSLRSPDKPAGETLAEVLTARRNLGPSELHPARALFSSDTLSQDLIRGLYARPALSSVLSRDFLAGDELRPAAGDTVVVVGSVIGGTGGGLTVPTLETIDSVQVRERIADVKIRGVFFGQYFTPETGRLAGNAQRFLSNQLLVLKSMEEALPMLQSIHIVGIRNKTVERDPEEEKEGRHFPWPRESSHPFWEGVQALHFLLGESAKDRTPGFRNREVSDIGDQPEIERARLRLGHALQIVQAFIGKETVQHIARENWVDSLWGAGLIDLVAHYWRTAIKMEGGDQMLHQFPDKVQQSLSEVWEGEGKTRGLKVALPKFDQEAKVRPQHLRKIPWPVVKLAGSLDPRLFEGHGSSAQRLAATLLFWILRKGEVR